VVTGVEAPAAAVGSALSDATGLPPGPDEDIEAPDPGEIWLDELSSVEVAPFWPSSMSFNSATTTFALP
jgi:hypothetical protein